MRWTFEKHGCEARGDSPGSLSLDLLDLTWDLPGPDLGPGPELDKSTCFTGFQSECKAAPGPPEIAPGVSSFDQSNMFQLFNLRVLSILMSFSTFIQLSRFFLASSIVQQIKIIERKVS